MFIKLENGVPVGNPITDENFLQLFPNTSFTYPFVPSAVEPFGYGMYDFSSPPTPGTYENVVEVAPVKNQEGIWIQAWEIEPMTPEEVAEKNQALMAQNKMQAESLLQQTDWTATVDISNPQYSNPYLANQDAFLAYRSQVRQIAINPPITVEVWPVKPEEVWATT
jgi:hypothetical protein